MREVHAVDEEERLPVDEGESVVAADPKVPVCDQGRPQKVTSPVRDRWAKAQGHDPGMALQLERSAARRLYELAELFGTSHWDEATKRLIVFFIMMLETIVADRKEGKEPPDVLRPHF